MKRLLLLIVSCLFVGNVFAAELKVGVVNLDAVLQKSTLAMNLNQQMSKDFQPRQEALNAAQKKLQDSIDQLTFTSYKLSQADRSSMQGKINTQRRELDQMSQSLQRDFSMAQNQNSQVLLSKLNTVVSKIAKDGSYDMIMTTNGMLYVNTAIDITPQVIDQLK